MRPSTPATAGLLLRLGMAVVGLAVFVAGAVAVFATSNGGGSAALVTVGAALVLLAALGDRVRALELGAAKLSLQDLAQDRFALAKEKEVAGDPAAATELRRQGLALQRLANEYAHLRRSMKGGHQRTRLLEDIVDQLARLASEHRFDPIDVWEWFNRGRPEARISAIGLMHGDPGLRDVFVALDAIERPRTPFEQFHGLRLAYEMLGGLSPLEREWLGRTVERVRRDQRFRRDSDRWALSGAIMDGLSGAPPSVGHVTAAQR
jgi:hypothetical protein